MNIQAPHILGATVKVMELVPQERIHEYAVEEITDVPVPRI